MVMPQKQTDPNALTDLLNNHVRPDTQTSIRVYKVGTILSSAYHNNPLKHQTQVAKLHIALFTTSNILWCVHHTKDEFD